jgi:putative transposase
VRGKPDEIAVALRNAERMLREGRTPREVASALGISRTTYYRWRRALGHPPADESPRITALECENARLRRILVDRELENDALRELTRRRW